MQHFVSADAFRRTSDLLNYPNILIVSVRNLIEFVPSISFVVIHLLFVAAAPLPFVLAALDTVRAPATVVAVVVAAVALAAAAEPAPPMDPENHPRGWTPSVAAAEVALPLLPIVLPLLPQLPPPLLQLPSLMLQTVLLLPLLLYLPAAAAAAAHPAVAGWRPAAL